MFQSLPWCLSRHYFPRTTDEIAALFNDSSYKIGPSSIPNAGRGLFAGKDFAKSSHVVDYYGFILTDCEYDWILPAFHYKIYTGVELKKLLGGSLELSLVGEPGWPGSLINHNKPANCRFRIYKEKYNERGFKKGFVVVETLKAIKKGDELFIDYGPMAKEICGE